MIQSVEFAIVGAGPAGLQLAWQLKQQNRSYVVIEAGERAGTFFSIYPRHRKLISINKIYTGYDDPEVNLRWDWNSILAGDDIPRFSEYSKDYFPHADCLVDYLNDFAEQQELNIAYNIRLTNVDRNSHDAEFELTLNAETKLECHYLVMATGRSVTHMPEILGIELAELYSDVSVDADDFRGQRVLIIGKGNSAFETADNLVGTASAIHLASPENLMLAWKSHYVGHLRAVNNNILDTYQLKSQNTIIDGYISHIHRDGDGLLVDIDYTHAKGQSISVPVDRVIVCTGFRFDHGMFSDRCMPELALEGTLPALTHRWESVNIPRLFFAGTLTHSRDYQKAFSGFIHGFRYNTQVLPRLIDHKYQQQPLPRDVVERTPQGLFHKLMHRAHTNSSLFQQPAFLCDTFTLDDSTDGGIDYYPNLPVDFVCSDDFDSQAAVFTLTMEYGKQDHPDPFNISRQPGDGESSAFIHPVVRCVLANRTLREYHVPEDLENNWYQPLYVEPFYRFLCDILGVDQPEVSAQDLIDTLEPPFPQMRCLTRCTSSKTDMTDGKASRTETA
jgi:thioredoxin reductase